MEEKLEQIERRLSCLERIVGTKLSQEKAREYLGCSRNTIIKYRELGLLKPHREGSRLYYNIADLNRFLS